MDTNSTHHHGLMVPKAQTNISPMSRIRRPQGRPSLDSTGRAPAPKVLYEASFQLVAMARLEKLVYVRHMRTYGRGGKIIVPDHAPADDTQRGSAAFLARGNPGWRLNISRLPITRTRPKARPPARAPVRFPGAVSVMAGVILRLRVEQQRTLYRPALVATSQMHCYPSMDVITRPVGETLHPINRDPRAGCCRQIRPGMACTTSYEVRAGCNEAHPWCIIPLTTELDSFDDLALGWNRCKGAW